MWVLGWGAESGPYPLEGRAIISGDLGDGSVVRIDADDEGLSLELSDRKAEEVTEAERSSAGS